ncbi:antifungal protein [Apiospora arundinis]
MQFSTVALLLFAVVGAVANPVEGSAGGIDAREVQITYDGTCSRSKNECKYKGQNGRPTIVKCPSFANKKVFIQTP